MIRRILACLGVWSLLVIASLVQAPTHIAAQYGCDTYEVGTNYSETICPTSSDATTSDSAEAQDTTALPSTDDDIVVTQTEVSSGRSFPWGITWLITILIIATVLGLWWLIAFWRRRKDDDDQHTPAQQ